MILVALRTGLRWGELCELRWGDIDPCAGRLMVKRAYARCHVGLPKNGEVREVPLSRHTVELLEKSRRRDADLVFCQRNGIRLEYHRMNGVLWRLCRLAGLREIGWHACRHTFASHLVLKGASLATVKDLLGHKAIEMTMRYAHVGPVVLRDAVSKLDEPPARHTDGT